jgi:hypothetical protein
MINILRKWWAVGWLLGATALELYGLYLVFGE